MTDHNPKNKKPNIYCLGPGGTFSIIAAQKFLMHHQADIKTVRVISDVLKGVAEGNGDYGVLPIENTVAGVVGTHQDLLIYYHKQLNVKIVSEVFCEIKFGLLANYDRLEELDFLYSHPHAFDQCQIYKAKYLKNAQIKFMVSTIKAASEFIKKAHEKQKIGAIVPLKYILENEDIRKFYASKNFKDGIQDTKLNTTRFFIIQKSSPTDRLDFRKQKTSIFIESLKDEAALLYKTLKPFAELNLNMSFLHSRSNLDNPWVYNFFLDFYNHTEKPQNTTTLINTLKQFKAIEVSVLGSYDSLKQDPI